MDKEELVELEIKAEVFRIVRNHSEKPKSVIMGLIKEHLPEATPSQIRKALEELVKR